MIHSNSRESASRLEGGPGNEPFSGSICTVCGSFRRGRDQLMGAVGELIGAGCRIASPIDFSFVRETEGFVYAEHELDISPDLIEARHLRAMEVSDFVWLHCPGGYVGRSAAMEIGFAHALGLKVFCSELPEDITLAGMVTRVSKVEDAVEAILGRGGDAPERSLPALQRYYEKMALRRGWADESAMATLERLRGEVDEFQAELEINQDAIGPNSPLAMELADIQLYLIHLANIVELDLGESVAAKEKINEVRFRSKALSEAA